MTAFDMAQRFIGVRELPGSDNAPLIQWFLELVGQGSDASDTVPWCSAFVNAVCWILRLPRSKSAAARSWLGVGQSVPLEQAEVGFDVVVLTRVAGEQPGPEIVQAPGHVGFFAGLEGANVLVLGGNQGNSVNVAAFPKERVLGVRRLAA